MVYKMYQVLKYALIEVDIFFHLDSIAIVCDKA